MTWRGARFACARMYFIDRSGMTHVCAVSGDARRREFGARAASRVSIPRNLSFPAASAVLSLPLPHFAGEGEVGAPLGDCRRVLRLLRRSLREGESLWRRRMLLSPTRTLPRKSG